MTKTQKKSLFRWFLNGGASLNYERMMSMAYTYSMLPWLKENYKGNPEGLKKSVKTHLQYYNCSPYMNPYVMGDGIERKCNRNFPLDSCNMDFKRHWISVI
ncbi:PTS system mannose-specific EIID component [Dorea longicatena]|nr:PTS system mannose-specific EIID component [Dorea longicatena]